MKRILLIVAFALAACGSDSAENNANNANNANNENNTRETEWTLEYNGAISGTLEGDNVAVVGSPSSTAIQCGVLSGDGGSMSMNLAGPEANTGTVAVSTFSATLEDGTECTKPMELTMEANVKTSTDDEYEMTFEGEMDCDGETISISGSVYEQ